MLKDLVRALGPQLITCVIVSELEADPRQLVQLVFLRVPHTTFAFFLLLSPW
jgi:hypothetical protein